MYSNFGYFHPLLDGTTHTYQVSTVNAFNLEGTRSGTSPSGIAALPLVANQWTLSTTQTTISAANPDWYFVFQYVPGSTYVVSWADGWGSNLKK